MRVEQQTISKKKVTTWFFNISISSISRSGKYFLFPLIKFIHKKENMEMDTHYTYLLCYVIVFLKILYLPISTILTLYVCYSTLKRSIHCQFLFYFFSCTLLLLPLFFISFNYIKVLQMWEKTINIRCGWKREKYNICLHDLYFSWFFGFLWFSFLFPQVFSINNAFH